jgi:hypothetical protein
MKSILTSVVLILWFCSCASAQERDSGLHNISIMKIIVKNSKPVVTILKIDSAGNIFKNDNAVGKSIDAQRLSKIILSKTEEIKIVKYPGDNEIKVIEYPFPPKNKQYVLFRYQLRSEVEQEKSLLNKTYYSWGGFFDVKETDLPIFKLFLDHEIAIFQELL